MPDIPAAPRVSRNSAAGRLEARERQKCARRSLQHADDLISGFRHLDAGLAERLLLALRRAPIAGDDRSGVTHALSLWRGPAGDEGHGLEPGATAEQLRRVLLGAFPHLADHYQVRRFRVLLEERDDIGEGHPEHRVTADADDGRLTHARR